MKVLAIGGGMVASEAEPHGDFGTWVRPYLPALRRYASRLVRVDDLDDVVQDALTRAWRRRSTYDPQRGQPLPWLLAIVADQARRHRTRAQTSASLDQEPPAHDRPPADIDLERALTKLSPRQRRAVDLYYFVGLDVSTVAATMSCAPGTVQATLFQARAALRELLGDHDD